MVKLNSSYSRMARSSGLSTPAPASRPLSQDTLRRWEKSALESSYICNQSAGFSRCLSKVQTSLQAQLRKMQAEQSKGKSSEKTNSVTDELQYLLKFNSSIAQCMAKTKEHLSEFVFINMANMTLARRDAYLAHVKAGIKQNTLSTLRQATIHLDKLFPDQILKRAEEDIAQHENKGRTAQPSSNYRKECFHPYQRSDKGARDQRSANRPGKTLVLTIRKGRAKPHSSQHVRPRPRRLVSPGQIPLNLSPAYTNTSSSLSEPRLASKLGKIRTGPQAGLRLCRLPVRLDRGQGQNKNQSFVNRTNLSGPATDVPHRVISSNRKAGPPRPTYNGTSNKTRGSQNHYKR